MVLFEVPAGEKISFKASKETNGTCVAFFDPNLKCVEPTLKLWGNWINWTWKNSLLSYI